MDVDDVHDGQVGVANDAQDGLNEATTAAWLGILNDQLAKQWSKTLAGLARVETARASTVTTQDGSHATDEEQDKEQQTAEDKEKIPTTLFPLFSAVLTQQAAASIGEAKLEKRKSKKNKHTFEGDDRLTRVRLMSPSDPHFIAARQKHRILADEDDDQDKLEKRRAQIAEMALDSDWIHQTSSSSLWASHPQPARKVLTIALSSSQVRKQDSTPALGIAYFARDSRIRPLTPRRKMARAKKRQQKQEFAIGAKQQQQQEKPGSKRSSRSTRVQSRRTDVQLHRRLSIKAYPDQSKARLEAKMAKAARRRQHLARMSAKTMKETLVPEVPAAAVS